MHDRIIMLPRGDKDSAKHTELFGITALQMSDTAPILPIFRSYFFRIARLIV